MTDRAALIALRDAVVDGWFPADVSARDLGLAKIVDETGLPVIRKMYDAFSGSVDAAIALLEAVLPGCPAQFTDMRPKYLGGSGWVVTLNWPHTIWQPTFTAPGPFGYEARHEILSRALLIATLNALIAKEPTDV